MLKKFALLLIITVLVSSCAIDPYTNEKKVSNTGKGAIIGVAGGAAVGAIAGGKKGALIGAAAGGVTGAAVGGYMDIQAKALRQELQGTGVSVKKEGNQITLVMPGNITFATNSYVLSESFKPTLTSVSKVLKKYNKTYVNVLGYTDNKGSVAINNTLSFNRANAVSNYFKLKGVSVNRLIVEGRGPTNPIASNSTANGREQNRRVEIILIQQ
ncbi:MAG: OmpA family protein [Rickettsiales bacterium]|nr:OmpA family protein [Rickettsiales bacterium]